MTTFFSRRNTENTNKALFFNLFYEIKTFLFFWSKKRQFSIQCSFVASLELTVDLYRDVSHRMVLDTIFSSFVRINHSNWHTICHIEWFSIHFFSIFMLKKHSNWQLDCTSTSSAELSRCNTNHVFSWNYLIYITIKTISTGSMTTFR